MSTPNTTPLSQQNAPAKPPQQTQPPPAPPSPTPRPGKPSPTPSSKRSGNSIAAYSGSPSTLAGDVREAFELVAIREKEVKQVRSDEAEIRRDHDACLFAQGKLQLQHGGPATTGSTGPLQEWRDRVEEAFTDYPSITPTNFPAPPPLRLGGVHESAEARLRILFSGW
ncbi:hypothetical protein LTR94_009113 [Friedmanniomyces endolithicus]|nr:hypothetical protein LTR94_009113 [Friedmanniomyces endolithicus]